MKPIILRHLNEWPDQMRKWRKGKNKMNGHDVHSAAVSRTMSFYIDVVPQPKQSTRFTLTGHAYTAPKKRKYLQDLVQQISGNIPKSFIIFEGRLRVSVVYSFPWRKSDAKTAKVQSWAYMDKRPDVDNLFKPVADALQTADVIRDDSQIVEVRARKIRSGSPGIGIKIEQISEFI